MSTVRRQGPPAWRLLTKTYIYDVIPPPGTTDASQLFGYASFFHETTCQTNEAWSEV